MKVLHGHTSAETAYVVDDYPYGFRLRCKIRYWIETKKGHGMRLVSQTSNPKAAGLVWNKPKGTTYSPFLAMYLDEKDHLQTFAVSPNWPATYYRCYGEGYYHQLPEDQRAIVDGIWRYCKLINPDMLKRQIAITGALSRLSPDHPNATKEELKALVEADNKSRYHDGDFDAIYQCWQYDTTRKVSHEESIAP